MREGRAILTTYYSESMYAPLWKRYYEPFFNHIERYVYPFEMKSDAQGRVSVINAKIKTLLEKYILVVIADLDEFLVPDPEKYRDLGDYLDRFNGPGARAVGWNVMEMPGSLPLDVNRKITNQRFYWQRDSEWYDKPVIATVPFNFTPGKHTCDKELPQDNDLMLLHLRDADLHYLVISCGIERDDTFTFNIIRRQLKAVRIPDKWRVF